LRPARSLAAPMKMGSHRGPEDGEGGGARGAHEPELELEPVIELEDADILEIDEEPAPSRPLQSSTDSLDVFLDRVWAARNRINSEQDVYDMYAEVTEPKEPLTGSPKEYMDRLSALNKGRKVKASIQGGMERGYWLYEREGRVPGQTRDRIYVNVASDHAVEMMEMVGKDIVDNPAFPRATLGKVAGPKAVGGRPDALVIYSEDALTTELVVERLRAYHEAHPSFFEPGTPPITQEVLEGVGVGESPPARGT